MSGSEYTYNHANRLISVTGPQSSVSFAYNGFGDTVNISPRVIYFNIWQNIHALPQGAPLTLRWGFPFNM